MNPKTLANLNKSNETYSENCLACTELLTRMRLFLDMAETVHGPSESDWLTVGEIASELKVSKSIVYRLIRHGELEAVNIVATNGKIPQKGHYRVRRSSLNEYLESKKVRPFPDQTAHTTRSRRFHKVKNHLGL